MLPCINWGVGNNMNMVINIVIVWLGLNSPVNYQFMGDNWAYIIWDYIIHYKAWETKKRMDFELNCSTENKALISYNQTSMDMLV